MLCENMYEKSAENCVFQVFKFQTGHTTSGPNMMPLKFAQNKGICNISARFIKSNAKKLCISSILS